MDQIPGVQVRVTRQFAPAAPLEAALPQAVDGRASSAPPGDLQLVPSSLPRTVEPPPNPVQAAIRQSASFPTINVRVSVPHAAQASGAPTVIYDVDIPLDASAAPAPLYPGVPVPAPPLVERQKADSPQAVRAQAGQVKAICKSLAWQDAQGVLGTSAADMADRFFLDSPRYADLAPRVGEAYRFAQASLQDLAERKVLGNIDLENGKNLLNPKRMAPDQLADAVAQHVGYASGRIAGLEGVHPSPNLELARLVLQSYFTGELRDNTGQQTDTRKLLADQLAKTAGGSEVVRDFVLNPDNDGVFAADAASSPAGLVPNLGAHEAGKATLRFAAKLLGGDDKAAAFVKHVFSRPSFELSQMLQDPQGPEGLVLHFAAMAHHQAWEWSKLGVAQVKAADGDPTAVKDWNNALIGSTTKLMAEDPDDALKVAEQINSFMVHQGLLVPCDRNGEKGVEPLSSQLDKVGRSGMYADPDNRQRSVSDTANAIKYRLRDEVHDAAQIDDWTVATRHAANVVANTCAAFAGHAVDADYKEREDLVNFYHNAIEQFAPDVKDLLANGVRATPDPKDDRYLALYQEKAGHYGLKALETFLGEGRTYDLTQNATFGDLIPQACHDLRLDMRPDFTPQNLAKDIEGLHTTLLKGDYFLDQPAFIPALKAEAQRPSGQVNPKDLQEAVRVPNAVWMWTQLMRGLVEKKPGRYTGTEVDTKSDSFPSGVQFNPPDVRDKELFAWARYRLQEQGQNNRDATRMALALIVLTQYKDLLQVRNAS